MQRAAIPFVALYGEEQKEVLELVKVKTLLSRYCKSGKVQRLEKGVYRNLTKVAGIQVSDTENTDPIP